MKNNPYEPPQAEGATPRQFPRWIAYDYATAAYFATLSLAALLHLVAIYMIKEPLAARITGEIQGFAIILAPIVFITWSFRVHKGLQRDFGCTTAWGHSVAFWGYVIPVASLYLPYAYVAEIHAYYRILATQPFLILDESAYQTHPAPRSPWVVIWWFSLLLFGMLLLLPSTGLSHSLGIPYAIPYQLFAVFHSFITCGLVLQVAFYRNKAYISRNSV